MPVGGDIKEIRYNHPTIGSGVWFAKSAEDTTFDPGGFRGDDDANAIDGGGRAIRKLNRVRWGFEGVVSWDMNNSNELDKAKQLSESPLEATWTFSHVNGTEWKGTGNPVGDVAGNANAATMAVKISGGGELKKILG